MLLLCSMAGMVDINCVTNIHYYPVEGPGLLKLRVDDNDTKDLFDDTAAILNSIVLWNVQGGKLVCICPLSTP